MPTIASEPAHPPTDAARPAVAAVAVHWRRRAMPPLGWIVPVIEVRPRRTDHVAIAWTGIALLALIFIAGIVAKIWSGS